jgi:hypothetical protein
VDIGGVWLLYHLFSQSGNLLVDRPEAEDDQTVGLNYYGLRPAGRDRFKRKLHRHATLLHPNSLDASTVLFDLP